MHGKADGKGAARPRGRAGEPRHTIYTPEWAAAVRRVGRLQGAERAFYAALLDHVEVRWRAVRPLQLLYERQRRRAREADGVGCLLRFMDGDLVDVFRGVALEAARLVPGGPPRPREGDPGDLEGEADCFTRYATLLAMAAAGPAVPQPLREVVERAAEGGAEWRAALHAMVQRLDAAEARAAA
ncbi:MAG TPA: hypothetical protein VFQ45_23390 [Longimicrobium sp.]|nr:hypothetical protein [Longimicrobium sp.]